MSQLQVTGEAKIRTLTGALTATAGVVTSVPLGAANGVATLGGDGKVPSAQLPTMASSYKGTWNAATNTPTIADGVGTAGDYYLVSTGGTWNGIVFLAGNTVIYSGTVWQKAGGGSGTVTSVGLAAPAAFSVSGSPVTSTGTLTLIAAGTISQYINGAGSLTTFPDLSVYVDLSTNQTIGGTKTFSSAIKADSGIRLKDGVATGGIGYVGIGSNAGQGLTLGIYNSGTVYYQDLFFPITNGYQYTFPASDGTIALTSNLSSYLPLAGGTLTGALNGTSAIFSSSVQSTDFRYTANGFLTYDTNATGTNTMQIRSGYAGAVLSFSGVGNASFSGNVGIGTSSPATTLDVRASIGSGQLITLANTSAFSNTNTLEIGFLLANANSGLVQAATIGTTNPAATGNNYGDIYFKTANTGLPIERMRITNGGNVGIGTDTPEALLHLNKATSGGEGAFIFLDNSAGSALGNKSGIRFACDTGATFSNYNAYIEALNVNAGNGATSLTFGTWNGASRGERMRITYNGNILVSTTTDNGQGKLQVNGAITATNVSYTGEFVNTTSTTLNTTYYHIIAAGLPIGQTYTLPSPTSNNLQYVIVNKTSFPQTISAGSGFTIYDMTGTDSATITLASKARCYIIADGSGFYQIF